VYIIVIIIIKFLLQIITQVIDYYYCYSVYFILLFAFPQLKFRIYGYVVMNPAIVQFRQLTLVLPYSIIVLVTVPLCILYCLMCWQNIFTISVWRTKALNETLCKQNVGPIWQNVTLVWLQTLSSLQWISLQGRLCISLRLSLYIDLFIKTAIKFMWQNWRLVLVHVIIFSCFVITILAKN